MNKRQLLLYELLAGCFLTFLMPWLFPGISDLQAGQKYYYDTKGNLITEEKYKAIVEQLRSQEGKPSKKGEDSKANNSTEENDTPAEEEQQVEAKEEEVDDEETEEDDSAVQYQVEVSSETIFRAFERDTDKFVLDSDRKGNTLVVPGYEYLRLDLGALEQEGISLHVYGWGRYDINDSSFYTDNPDGELLYGYLEYNSPEHGLNLTLGRQHVMAGIINNSIDGLGIKSALTSYFKFALYGGSPVELSSEKGREGDSFWGGRIAGHRGADYEIGLSYKNKRSDGNNDEEIAAVDLFAELPFNINLLGFSSYNMDTRGWGEHSYELRFDISDFYFRPFYQRFRYEDFFNTKDNSANPFRFLAQSGEILSTLGSDFIWQRFAQIDLGAKVNYYDYDRRDETALYFEGNASWHLNGLTQIGGQFGRMNGDTAETRYLLTRAFFYWNIPSELLARLGFITGDVIYVHYDEQIFGKDHSLWLSLGGGWRFFNDALEVKLSGDWSNDPFFDSDIRGLLKIQYEY